MSRIGNKVLSVPTSVTVSITGDQVLVKGPKGELSLKIPAGIIVTLDENTLSVKRENNERQTRAMHGMVRSILGSHIIGVNEGFVKKLELVGTGYRAKKQGADLNISIGHSHPDIFKAVPGVELNTESDTVIVVSGIDKQIVGQAAANIRELRPPEPYKGKGIRYQGEVIRRKAGKAAKSGA